MAPPAEAPPALPAKTREMHNHHMDSTIWNDFAFRDGDGEFSCVLGRPVEAETIQETNQPTNQATNQPTNQPTNH
jgi:hypothetical protein